MAPIPVWTEDIRVRAYETDIHNLWKPSAFFLAFQDAATNHAANLGYDYHSMHGAGRAWVLSRMKVYFYRFPSMGDPLTVRTWPSGIRQKIFFSRELEVISPQGDKYAAATSAWLLIDSRSRRMLLPEALPGALPENPGLEALNEDLMKIPASNGLAEKFTVRAAYSDVDLLGHVNNARYIDWIMDCFPFEHFERFQPAWLQINFNNEVRGGESVRVSAGEVSGNPSRWLVVGEKSDSAEKAFEAELAWAARQTS